MKKVLIVDFGSQYTQLIARRVREQHVYCEIHPFHRALPDDPDIGGVILSGGPCSVNQPDAPDFDIDSLKGIPTLAVCYGAQLLAKKGGGKVESSDKREYGRARLQMGEIESPLFHALSAGSQVWMSHGDTILELPEHFHLIGSTESVEVAAFQHDTEPHYALQFHPEVTHSIEGSQIMANFLYDVCGLTANWTPAAFVETTVAELKAELDGHKVICGLSGGVDSTVAASLIHRAIGKDLYCIFVDNGLLRKNEYAQVLDHYKHLGLNVIGVDARDKFLSELKGVLTRRKSEKSSVEYLSKSSRKKPISSTEPNISHREPSILM